MLEVIIDPCIIHGRVPGEEGKRIARVAGSENAPLHTAPHYICHLGRAFRPGLPFLSSPYTHTHTQAAGITQAETSLYMHTYTLASNTLSHTLRLCSLTSLYDLSDDDFDPTWHLLRASHSVCCVHPNLTSNTIFELFPEAFSSALRPPEHISRLSPDCTT